MNDHITTDIFCINKSHTIRNLFLIYGRNWIVGTIAVAAFSMLWGFLHDVRWVIVSLMIIFIVAPFLLSFLFIYYAFDQISVTNSLPHRLEFSPGGITVSVFSVKDENGNGKEKGNDTCEEKGCNVSYALIYSRKIDYSEIDDYIAGLSDVVLRMKSKGSGFLIVKPDAFSGTQQFSSAMKMVSTKITPRQQD